MKEKWKIYGVMICMLGSLIGSGCSKQNHMDNAEEKSYQVLIQTEKQYPVINKNEVCCDLSELLDRVLLLEQQLLTYPGGKYASVVKERYLKYLHIVITGETKDSKQSDIRLYYDSKTGKIDGKAIETYNAFITNHPGSVTASILAAYLEILDQEQREPGEKTQSFYDSLTHIVEKEIKQST